MTLIEYFANEPRGAKKEMAEYLGITETWMSLLISRKKLPSGQLAVRIENATSGLVPRASLRPDLFAPFTEAAP